MKPAEAKVLDGLRKTTLAYLSDKQYTEVVEAVEKQGILGLTGAASRLVKGAVVKHGSHDQKTHGRGGGGGGSSGGSSSASSASSSSGEKELNGLADSAESDSQSLQNEAEDTQLELTNSGLSNNSPDVRTARIMSQSLKNANKSFKEAKEAKGVDAKKGKLRSGYNSLSRAFDVSNNSEINTLEDIAEGIGRTMEKLEQGLGLDSRS
jgi:hypothetical protein